MQLAEQAARATSTPKAFVWIWLLQMAWRANNSTFTISNEQLRAFGLHRNTKYQALRELERAGLIQVSREGKKARLVTLLYLAPCPGWGMCMPWLGHVHALAGASGPTLIFSLLSL